MSLGSDNAGLPGFAHPAFPRLAQRVCLCVGLLFGRLAERYLFPNPILGGATCPPRFPGSRSMFVASVGCPRVATSATFPGISNKLCCSSEVSAILARYVQTV